MNLSAVTFPFSILNNNLPDVLIADETQKPPLFPVTLTIGVFPFGAHVFPMFAVSEIPASS